jgi:ABC-2 type transport system permease protein
MPIFDQGYQHWQGTLSGHGWRWLTIARHGIRVQMKNRWARQVMLLAWMPALGLVAALALWGLAEQIPELHSLLPERNALRFWTQAYSYFFYAEVIFSMLLVVLIGPDLISQDLRFNTLPLYFSRPLTRLDYFLGKFGVIVFCLGAVMIAPAVVGYVLGIAFSLNLSVIKDTIHLLPAVIAYGTLVAVAAGTVMLGLSSLSRNSRYVGMLWLGLWIIGNMLAGAFTEGARVEWGPLLSFDGNMRRVGNALLDVESAEQQLNNVRQSRGPMPPEDGRGGPGRQRQPAPSSYYREPVPDPPWTWSAAVLLGLMGLSLWILSSRVKSLDRLR